MFWKKGIQQESSNNMKVLKESNLRISTILAFALIPLTGFATDVYIPSLPSMAKGLHVTTSEVQLSLVIFFISSGVSQLFTGAIVDSFGRYRISLWALGIFAAASFAIGFFPNLLFFYAMRVVQGVTVSLIVVGKRAFFVDNYSGEKLKHYTSLFVIFWSAAPILAPFIGGYLQSIFGWQANFFFLGILALLFLVLELIFSGESLKYFHPFAAKPILDVYGHMLQTKDFTLGLVILGSCYAMPILYGMSSPFIIERVFHLSPVVTGYSSLLSGCAILVGGLIAKSVIEVPIARKVPVALAFMVLFAVLMLITGPVYSNVYVMIGLTIGLHGSCAVIYNVLYGYCLTRFAKNAGTASGLTGGGMYVTSSIVGYGIVNIYHIRTQTVLGIANITGAAVVITAFLIFNYFRNVRLKQEAQTANAKLAI